ncbi:MAG: MraY family glycosyltransferase [Eubacteriales bacterium]|nr:MraY family glycosyltransferase [Eubacteriales bacterium]
MAFFQIFTDYYSYMIAFLLAFVISLASTPLSMKIAYKVGALDKPKKRGMHSKIMPRAGGLAIFTGFIITVLFLMYHVAESQRITIWGLLLGATIITSLGFIDDIYGLRPRTRIVVQLIAALIAVMTGTRISDITIPLLGTIEFGIFSNVITVFWIIGVTNAVNLLDGLDGLATGVASIACTTLMIIAVIFGDPMLAGLPILLTAALAGSCLGFLPYNFNPAKIFMGDTGSTFLGYSLAVISIQTMLKTYTAMTLVVAVIVLALPIGDTLFAIIRRTANRRPISEADRGHLHHRLIDKGLSHKKAVLTLYFVSGLFGLAAILIVIKDAWVAVIILCLVFGIWIFDNLRHHRQEKRNRETESEEI